MSSADPTPPPLLLLAWTTVARQDEAEALARALLAEKLVACVQIDGPITSLYPWQGRLETSREFRLLCKLPAALWDRTSARLRALHPYSTPEWVALPATHVDPAYLAWASTACVLPA